MGDSRGRWEGDTLVVSVRHFTPDTWLDRAGNFHSEEMQLTERYSLLDRDTINYEVTIRGSEGLYASVEDEHAPLPAKGTERPVARYPCYAFDGVAVGTRAKDKLPAR